MPGLGYYFREDNFGHPGYTSEDVTGRVIKSFVQPGWKILDPFSGTGTTGKMATVYGNDFTGIELENQWYELSEKRIAQAQLQIRMPI